MSTSLERAATRLLPARRGRSSRRGATVERQPQKRLREGERSGVQLANKGYLAAAAAAGADVDIEKADGGCVEAAGTAEV